MPSVTVNGCVFTGRHQPSTSDYPRALDIFYGIPYARAQRFKAPVRADPVSGARVDASEMGSGVPVLFAPYEMAENPLSLNVFRPSSSSSSSSSAVDPAEEGHSGAGLLPVVVYVHGGAFNFGHALDRDVASLVSWAGSPVLAVSVSYRLGALGFPLPGEGRGANLGLRDQRMAVEWVRRWVGAFGGDGGDVTMMGMSAGAHSIGHHMLGPLGGVTKAILESGAPTARSVLSTRHARTLSQWGELETRVGAPLEDVPVEELVEASMGVFASTVAAVTWPFQPVVDGDVIPDVPLNLWEVFSSSGRGEATSVIIGFCSHEGTLMAPQDASTSAEFRAFFAALIPALSASDLDSLEMLYPDPLVDPASPYRQPPGTGGPRRRPYGAQFRRIHEALGHYAYICPVLHTAHALSRAGARVYVYEYAALADPFRAASHGDHAPVAAHQMSLLRDAPGLVAVADHMTARWTRFIASPEGRLPDSGEHAWPLFRSPLVPGSDSSSPGQLLVFGEGNDEAAGGSCRGTPVKTRTLSPRELDQCRFWWERMHLSQGLCEPAVAAKVFHSK